MSVCKTGQIVVFRAIAQNRNDNARFIDNRATKV